MYNTKKIIEFEQVGCGLESQSQIKKQVAWKMSLTKVLYQVTSRQLHLGIQAMLLVGRCQPKLYATSRQDKFDKLDAN